MVHGGGHHGGGGGGGGWGSSGGGHHHHGSGWGGQNNRHHHRSSGGWFGRGRPYQNTNVVVVNNDRYAGSSQYPSYQQINPHHYNSDADCDCEECCRKCCEWTCCSCCVCCAVTSGTGSCPLSSPRKVLCQSIVLSVVALIIMLVMSNKNDSWTLNAGESRRVPQPWLTNQFNIHSNIADSIAIYALGQCPSLTGPTVILDSSIDVELSQGDYQYDYFYLNAGSTINVTVAQKRGASDVLLIRGKGNLDRWEDDDDDFDNNDAVIRRYAGAGQVAQLLYRAADTDFYVVVYDNASGGAGSASVHYHVVLTTYDLKGRSPIPSSWCDATTNTCSILKRSDCILVQAKSRDADVQSNSDGVNVVTVTITASRRWGLIAFLSVLPMMVGLWLQKRSDTAADVERPPAYAPLTPSEESPSAPPEATGALPVDATATYEPIAVIVPEENVIPVPPPSNGKV